MLQAHCSAARGGSWVGGQLCLLILLHLRHLTHASPHHSSLSAIQGRMDAQEASDMSGTRKEAYVLG